MNVYLVFEYTEDLPSVLAVYASVVDAIELVENIAYQHGLTPSLEEDNELIGVIAEHANESYSTVVWVEERGVLE